ncbi:hypothetical protein [Vibrio parahaemolyticus]|uniref:hypothetical protein n=1 Tax=Vibrio parahaemolyticus TaxID=670 RepID=UPI000410A7A0|nr:hypothetical protein [Vibrio parahaemolyticus]ANB97527.1 hypothetical protein FORC14_1114 [Vibrio parahaemolyticus]EGQ9271083.1 hypothetical protein [Vibrio parahaemolyticus]EGQ9710657.1 hypothetical protein [Vibrio parahaemolyticus]EGQ9798142.1 hypothetical protein [Vibrio parahaemolyticus]EGR1749475.1 hypothetical protein [Vibrio parahaemolyticus]
MRDPKRIEITLLFLKELWGNNANLRFNQLMYNLQRECLLENDGKGQITEISQEGIQHVGYDLFYIEDDIFIQFLERKLTQKQR